MAVAESQIQANQSDDTALAADRKINIQSLENKGRSPVIFLFSSLDVLSTSFDSEQSYIELPVRSLFEMTLAASHFLNPQSDDKK